MSYQSVAEKERLCIEIALQTKKAILINDYKEQLDKSVLDTQFRNVTWAPSLPKRMLQTSLVIIIIPLSKVLPVLMKAATCLRQRSRLKALERESAALRPPQTKSISLFWEECGPPCQPGNWYYEERLWCLERWVAILYGDERATAIDVRGRIRAAHKAMGDSFREAQSVGVHICFENDIDGVVKKMDDDLPSYAEESTTDESFR